MNRCPWAIKELDMKYHDEEWGREVHDDNKLFELLILEGMQAGLSWSIILSKRENFKKAFDNFNYEICSKYTDEYLEKLRGNKGIIRNKLKIYSVRKNALAFIKIREEFGTFDNYIWKFVDYKKINNSFKTREEVPTKSELSDTISKDLKKRGFNFVGSTIIYSYLQAVGILNDHLITCDCYRECL